MLNRLLRSGLLFKTNYVGLIRAGMLLSRTGRSWKYEEVYIIVIRVPRRLYSWLTRSRSYTPTFVVLIGETRCLGINGAVVLTRRLSAGT